MDTYREPNLQTNLQAEVIQAFETRFGTPPEIVVRAPGRVNLIGEHTDYNGGFVLPMAIEKAVWLALKARPDDLVEVHSLEQKGAARFDLGSFKRGEGWAEYLKGVAWALQQGGKTLAGWEGVLASNVPLGAGLSSSAALELAAMRAFAETSGFAWEPKVMAQLAQRAENEWVGALTGIMDQLISACGEAGRALLIDCRSLETEAVPLPPETVVVVMDTATRHKHVESGYNDRRRECEEAAAFFGVAALRDVSQEDFDARASELADARGETVRRRAAHVVSENARTLAAAEAMRRGDAAALGKLMDESHLSMQSDFEISSNQLDLMVSLAQSHAACLGARMTGGGFAGCAVALVEASGAPAFADEVGARYHQKSGLGPALYLCEGAAGVSSRRL